MIVGIGIDILDLKDLKRVVQLDEKAFLKKIYTKKEIAYAKQNNWLKSLGSTFAAKEAVFKAVSNLGLKNICFKEIEILRNQKGKPEVVLSGETKEIIKKAGKYEIMVSITNASTFVIAQSLIQKHSNR